MAKVKFDLKSLEIPAAAQKPVYAVVGAGDLAYAAVNEYVADVQKRFTQVQKDAKVRVEGVQKTVTDLDAASLRKQAVDVVAARRTAVEARVAELQKDAKEIPAKVQTLVNENVATVTSTYADLAKRGEARVKGAKPVAETVKAPAAKPAAKKAAAKKAPAKKAAAKKAPAKKAAAKKA